MTQTFSTFSFTAIQVGKVGRLNDDTGGNNLFDPIGHLPNVRGTSRRCQHASLRGAMK